MEHFNRKLLQLKEKELATLDKRTSDRRSTLERELATVERQLGSIDEQAERERVKLERDIRVLQQAAHIEEETLNTSKPPPKGYSKQEREELFEIRSQVMRRLLTEAKGGEVPTKALALALNRPESTIRDYYNEQLEVRPADCFWQTGIDKAHFRWRDGDHPSNTHSSRAPQAVRPAAPPERWQATLS